MSGTGLSFAQAAASKKEKNNPANINVNAVNNNNSSSAASNNNATTPTSASSTGSGNNNKQPTAWAKVASNKNNQDGGKNASNTNATTTTTTTASTSGNSNNNSNNNNSNPKQQNNQSVNSNGVQMPNRAPAHKPSTSKMQFGTIDKSATPLQQPSPIQHNKEALFDSVERVRSAPPKPQSANFTGNAAAAKHDNNQQHAPQHVQPHAAHPQAAQEGSAQQQQVVPPQHHPHQQQMHHHAPSQQQRYNKKYGNQNPGGPQQTRPPPYYPQYHHYQPQFGQPGAGYDQYYQQQYQQYQPYQPGFPPQMMSRPQSPAHNTPRFTPPGANTTPTPIVLQPSPRKAIKIVNPNTGKEIGLPKPTAAEAAASSSAPEKQPTDKSTTADTPEHMATSKQAPTPSTVAKPTPEARPITPTKPPVKQAQDKTPKAVKPESTKEDKKTSTPSVGLVLKNPVTGEVLSITKTADAKKAEEEKKLAEEEEKRKKKLAEEEEARRQKQEAEEKRKKLEEESRLKEKALQDAKKKSADEEKAKQIARDKEARVSSGLAAAKADLLKFKEIIDKRVTNPKPKPEPVSTRVDSSALKASLSKRETSPVKPAKRTMSPVRVDTKKDGDAPPLSASALTAAATTTSSTTAAHNARVAKLLKSTADVQYPSEIENPNIESGSGKKVQYTMTFLLAMKQRVRYCPENMVDLAAMINDSPSSPSISKRASIGGRGMQRQNSTQGSYGGKSNFGGYKLSQSGRSHSQASNMTSKKSFREDRRGNRGGRQSQAQIEVVEPLKFGANAWRPKRDTKNAAVASDDADVVQTVPRKVNSILNKLAPEKFVKLSDEILHLGITDEVILKVLINKIFDKALLESHFGGLYAKLCKKLSFELPKVQTWIALEDDRNNIFRRVLLNKCQEEFEKGATWAAEEAKAREMEKQADTMTQEEKDQFLEDKVKRIKTRQRSLGNVKFVGELFKEGLLTEKIIHKCVVDLLNNNEPSEEDVEAVVQLMTKVGKHIDTSRAVEHMRAYFDQLKRYSQMSSITSKNRYALLDLIDLRANKWVGRNSNASAGPKTLAEIRKDVEKAQSEKEKRTPPSMHGDRRDRGSNRRDMPSLRDQSRFDRGSRGGRSSQDSRLPSNADGWSTISRTSEDSGSEVGDRGGNKWNSPGMKRSTSSRGSSRPTSPAISSPTQQIPKEAPKKANMFDILSDGKKPSDPEGSRSLEGSSTSLERSNSDVFEETMRELSDEEKQAKVTSMVREWFGILDMKEMLVSLTEIGTSYHDKFVSALLCMGVEQKMDSMNKAIELVKTLIKDDIVSVDTIKAGMSLFFQAAEDDGLFSEFPLAPVMIGNLSAELLIAEYLSFDEVNGMWSDDLKFGRKPDSSLIFAALVNKVKVVQGEQQACVLFGEFDMESLWEKKPDEETLSEFYSRNKLQFLKDAAGGDSQGNNNTVALESLLGAKLGTSCSASDVIQDIYNIVDEDYTTTPEFMKIITNCILKYMMAETILPSSSERPKTPTREMYIKLEEIMSTQCSEILSNFVSKGGSVANTENSLKLVILTTAKNYANTLGYPKNLLEHLFRLFSKVVINDNEVYFEWKKQADIASDGKVKKELKGWYESLEQE